MQVTLVWLCRVKRLSNLKSCYSGFTEMAVSGRRLFGNLDAHLSRVNFTVKNLGGTSKVAVVTLNRGAKMVRNMSRIGACQTRRRIEIDE